MVQCVLNFFNCTKGNFGFESVDVVLKDYGGIEPYNLHEMTHAEKPWQIARGDLPEDAKCNNEITVESMGEYYGSL